MHAAAWWQVGRPNQRRLLRWHVLALAALARGAQVRSGAVAAAKRRERRRRLFGAPKRCCVASCSFLTELRRELADELRKDVAAVGHGLDTNETSAYAMEHLGHTDAEKKRLAQQVLAARAEEEGRGAVQQQPPKVKQAW